MMQTGQYERAILLARKALPFARKTWVKTMKTKHPSYTYGFATFNLGYALLKSGRCSEALPYLERSIAVEPPGKRPYIEPRITQAKACLQGGASGQTQSQSSGGRQAPSPTG